MITIFTNFSCSFTLIGDSGPTDLSMKSKPLLTHKLNPTELATVRQLITGYRESAAFLLRSADELEQLLIQQQQFFGCKNHLVTTALVAVFCKRKASFRSDTILKPEEQQDLHFTLDETSEKWKITFSTINSFIKSPGICSLSYIN